MNEPLWFNVLVGFGFALVAAGVGGFVYLIATILAWSERRFGQRGVVVNVCVLAFLLAWFFGTLASINN